MSEVEGFIEGERDYLQLKGGTGPLVYPAGFVYIYSFLYHLTDKGSNILLAQYVFMGLYLVLLSLVFWVYAKSSSFPPLLFPLLALSKRVHSIFMLRMFNDGVAILIFYLALVFFLYKHWKTGCLFFSLAVSVKMNILLFAPGLLLLLLMHHSLFGTLVCLGICGFVQVLLGWPFLTTYPVSYLSKAFEFSRVFFYKWTVNWKFLSEETFLSKEVSHLLLLSTVFFLILFALKLRREYGLSFTQKNLREGEKLTPVTFFLKTYLVAKKPIESRDMLAILFLSQFIGIAFARTLHYQFYAWYFHTLPFLYWHSGLLLPVQLFSLIAIEVAFNIFPATSFSSSLLFVSHLMLLIALYLKRMPKVEPSSSEKED